MSVFGTDLLHNYFNCSFRSMVSSKKFKIPDPAIPSGSQHTLLAHVPAVDNSLVLKSNAELWALHKSLTPGTQVKGGDAVRSGYTYRDLVLTIPNA